MSRFVGCAVSLAVALLLLVGGLHALLDAYSKANGCSPLDAGEESAARGAANDLDAALAASSGVQASSVKLVGSRGGCSALFRAEATFRISATPDQVGQAARLVAETKRRPAVDAVPASVTFGFDETGQDKALGKEGDLYLNGRVPVEDLVAESQSWAPL